MSSSSKARTLKFSTEQLIGNGSFGVVFEARIVETGETVAIKKVLQDRRYKNRELSIMKTLSHTNVVKLKHCFYTTGEDADEVYLNLVLEYVPETVYDTNRRYVKSKMYMPMLEVKLYMYQLCRSLAYIHSLGVCHRDIKPQNLLCNPRTHELKLCDFGSAKNLVAGETNVAYICSRYYRAPELIFGATQYTCVIDVWSAGCMLGELLMGRPLFPGKNSVEQMVEIIKVIGSPTIEQMDAMNPHYTDMSLPQVEAKDWRRVFHSRLADIPESAFDLLSAMLKYVPTERLTALECLAHPFFDELRTPGLTRADGGPLPELFNFDPSELASARSLGPILIPPHARTSKNWPPGMYEASSGASSVTVPSPSGGGGSGGGSASAGAGRT